MKISINGFGRIGRIFFRQAFARPDFDPVRNNQNQVSIEKNYRQASSGEVSNGINIVAINDLGDIENLAYLLKYDSVYGRFNADIKTEKLERGGKLTVNGKEILVFQEKEPQNLPWKDLGIDVVVESTGFFTSYEKAEAHIKAGAKRVVITAPAHDEKTITATPNAGIEFLGDMQISSNASCTTNATIPIVKIMAESIGIKKALLNTVHGYTATQGLVDQPDTKDFRRGRAGAQNIVPSSTGAAEAVLRVIPEMKGIFDGIAMRIPIISGSLIDFTFLSRCETSAEEINNILREAANSPEWQGIFKITEDPLVSTDILGEPYGSIADLAFTRVAGGDLAKILSWYDNEWGYSAMLIKHIESLKNLL